MNDRCADMRTAIAEILAGASPSVDPKTVERHIEECPDCRGYRQGLLRDDRLLNGFVKSVDERLPLMEEKIMKSIDERIARPEASPKRAGARRLPAVFHSRFMQFAAAVVVVLAVILSVKLADWQPGSGIAWAEVIRKVEDAKDFICRVQKETSGEPDLEMVEYRSAEYGVRVDMFRDGRLVAEQHIGPSGSLLTILIHRDKAYATVELTDEQRAARTDASAKELIQFFRSMTFDELGKKTIDGVRATGIEVKNPEIIREVIDESTIRLWVDDKTQWPIRIEMSGVAREGKVRVNAVYDRFQWNPSLKAEDFAFEIPADYKMRGEIAAARRDEAAAVEAMREFAGFLGGRYPSSLSLATAFYEADAEIKRRQRSGGFGAKDLESLMKIQSACAFYSDLVKAGKDPAWNGHKVAARDFDRVLLRWRLDDGRYRVIYGDLRAENVSVERLEELEKRR